MDKVNNVQSVLDELKKSLGTPLGDDQLAAMGLQKATFNQPANATTGLNYYDLEAGAKFLVPVLTPLRNEIPRVSGRGGTQANWRAITGINTGKIRIGVSEGNRGGVIDVSTQDYLAIYRGIGLEGNATFEADYAAQGFDDVRAQAGMRTLQSLMIGEEITILGGNGTLALGTTATPSLSASTSGGSLATSTQSVICVALTLDGFVNGSVSGGIQASITRTNPDGSSDTHGGGCAQKSAAASQAVTGPTASILATVTAKTNAVGYAWFWGTAGNETLGAITTINSIVITAAATGTQLASALPSSDQSQNTLIFDGLLTLCNKGLGSYAKTLATGTAGVGTPLTGDGAGGIVEIDDALQSFWDNWRLSPDAIWVSSQEAKNISRKILAGNANAAQRFVFNSAQDAIGGGVMVRSYLNRFSMAGGKEIPIRIHPNLPNGTLLFTSMSIPYQLSGVNNVIQVKTRKEYYQVEWPLRTRKYEYGVYADEVLQHYFPASMGYITNIGNG